MSCGDDCGLALLVPVKFDVVALGASYKREDRRVICLVGGSNPYPAAQFHAVLRLNFPGIGPIGSQYKYDVDLTAQKRYRQYQANASVSPQIVRTLSQPRQQPRSCVKIPRALGRSQYLANDRVTVYSLWAGAQAVQELFCRLRDLPAHQRRVWLTIRANRAAKIAPE